MIDLVIAATAFTGMLYQVISARDLGFLFNSSSYSMTTVLSSYLLGLAAGNAVYPKLRPILADSRLLASRLLLGLAVFSTLVFCRFETCLRFFADAIPPVSTPLVGVAIRFLVASLFLLVPAAILGAAFAALYQLRVDRTAAPERSDLAYARFNFVDLLGSVAGAWVTGFFLIPRLGSARTAALGAVVDLIIAVGLMRGVAPLSLRSGYLRKAWTLAGCAICTVSIATIRSPQPRWFFDPRAGSDLLEDYFKGPDKTIIYSARSPFGEIHIVDREMSPGAGSAKATLSSKNTMRSLFLNRRPLCSVEPKRGVDVTSESRIAQDSLSFARRGDLRIADIGLGCGITLGRLLRSPETASVDVIEINPAIEAASRYFSAPSQSPVDDRRTHLRTEDGWSFFGRKVGPYDVVVLDVEEPTAPRSTALYTADFFDRVRQNLAPDGIFSVWSYFGSAAYQAIIYRTLRSAFKYVVYHKADLENANDAPYYIASNEPFRWASSALTDTDLALTLSLQADPGEVNTLDHPILLEAWFASSGRDPIWR